MRQFLFKTLRMRSVLMLVGCAMIMTGCSQAALTTARIGPNVTLKAKTADKGPRPLILCAKFAPLTYDSRVDSKETIDGIEINNAKWVAACEPKEKSNG